MKQLLLAAVMTLGSASMAPAADMTGEELSSLLKDGEKLTLGGKGQGYKGTLTVRADGTASGSATPDGGQKLTISGTWRINGNQFCRTWKGIDGGKEVCETWSKNGDRSATVMVNGKKTGVNSW